MAARPWTEAEARQVAFDAMLDRVTEEGRQGHADGIVREDCPYLGHPEPHVTCAWLGGWALSALGCPDFHPDPRAEVARLGAMASVPGRGRAEGPEGDAPSPGPWA